MESKLFTKITIMNLLESLKWRSAIKKFDTSKKVSQEDIETLLTVGNLAPTSGGLQPFKIIVVSNDDLKKKLVAASYQQPQVADASHLLVFAIEQEINEETVNRYIKRAEEVRGKGKESLIAYSESMKYFISTMDEATKYTWARSQAYISLGMVMAAAAEIRIDSCPMEGLVPDKYQEMLGLKSKNLMPVVILPIGYRSEEDVHSKEGKIRKIRDNFVIEIN